MQWATRIMGHLAAYRRAETLINIGAYSRGSNPEIDLAIHLMGDINAFLRQDMNEKADYASSLAALRALAERRVEMTDPRAPVRAGSAGA